MTKRIAQQAARKTVSKGLGRLKNSNGEGFVKNLHFFFRKCVAKSTGLGFVPETVIGPKIKY